jgi:hypothetical protein
MFRNVAADAISGRAMVRAGILRNVARVDQWAALVIFARALACAFPLLVAGMFGACGSPYHLTPSGVNTTSHHGVRR